MEEHAASGRAWGQGYRVSVPFFFEPDFGARVRPLGGVGVGGREVGDEGHQRLGEGGGEVVYGEHLVAKVRGNFGGGGGGGEDEG